MREEKRLTMSERFSSVLACYSEYFSKKDARVGPAVLVSIVAAIDILDALDGKYPYSSFVVKESGDVVIRLGRAHGSTTVVTISSEREEPEDLGLGKAEEDEQ